MSVLNRILDQKRMEIAAIPTNIQHGVSITPQRSLRHALQQPGLQLIAEVKKASPSKGVIHPHFDHYQLANQYVNGGAAALSVLTDAMFFQGHASYLTDISQKVSVPVLRKDFIIDPLQVVESKTMGADAILLILDVLSTDQANDCLAMARDMKLDVLLELHGQDALDRLPDVYHTGIIGVNNRDLHTFDMDMSRAITFSQTIRRMAPDACIVAESGYHHADQCDTLDDHGIDGVLIGEGLCRSSQLLSRFQS